MTTTEIDLSEFIRPDAELNPEQEDAPPDLTPGAYVEYQRMVDREAAKRYLAQRNTAELLADLPASASMVDLLAQDLGEVDYLVDELWPINGNVLLAAPNKAGKSTLVGNLIRALVDGDAFLDCFAPSKRVKVALIDDELPARTLQKWLRDQRIEHPENVQIEMLRGRVGAFNLANPHLLAEWVRRLQGVDVLILDCLRPVLDAAGLSEDKEAGQFLRGPLATLAAEAGIGQLLVVHHTGHEGTRARGDSALLDWPDAKWTLTKTGDDHGPRVLEAFGRDVDVKPRVLTFNPMTRRLRYDAEATPVPSLQERRAVSKDNTDRFAQWLDKQDPDAEYMASASKAKPQYRKETDEKISDKAGNAAFKNWQKRSK